MGALTCRGTGVIAKGKVMLPFDIESMLPKTLSGPGVIEAPDLAPVVKDFDPDMETLSFTLSASDAESGVRLRDLPEGAGCRVEVGDRVLVTLMGVRADEIGPNALEFEFED